jgi:hypothetical protein
MAAKPNRSNAWGLTGRRSYSFAPVSPEAIAKQPPIADVRSRSRPRRDLDAHTTLTQFIISHHI